METRPGCLFTSRLVVVLSVIITGLTASLAPSAYGQSIQLAWDASSDSNVTGYNVYRSQQSGVFSSTPLNGSSVLMTAAFTDSSVQSGSTYYYVVTAVSTTGVESDYSNQVQATVPVTVINQAPVVSAGPAQTITLPANATLTATATDDGLPNGVLTYSWTVVSGHGVTLSSPTASSTQASFSAAGTYTLRVTVSDGQLSASADVIVTVQSAPSLTLLVSKSGTLLGGMITSIRESSSDPQVTRLELYIDENKVAFADSTSLTYRWDLRRVTGTHVVSGRAYNSNNVVVATASQSVSVIRHND